MKQRYLVGVVVTTLSLSACQNMGNLQSVMDLGAQIAMASVYGNQTSMVGGLKG